MKKNKTKGLKGGILGSYNGTVKNIIITKKNVLYTKNERITKK